MITTEAWVLHRGGSLRQTERGELVKETISLGDIGDGDVLVEPLYGCWEGNMTHAIRRDPIDVCVQRRESKIVLGNSGVVRVLKLGPGVEGFEVGDIAGLVPLGRVDSAGFPSRVFGYDEPGTVGLLAKQTKVQARQLFRAGPTTLRYSLQQWAGFTLRYASAWSNWLVAYGCWKVQRRESGRPPPFVAGWGGGVAYAELLLAKHAGCRVAMFSSNPERLRQIEAAGIKAIDRRPYADLHFDAVRFDSDHKYKLSYLKTEREFLNMVAEISSGEGVDIFIDNIGTPVHRASLRSLARHGVFTSLGWLDGMSVQYNLAVECCHRHIHVHTHGASYAEGIEAVRFAEEHAWLPPIDVEYGWDDIPQLAHDFETGKISSFFPIYQTNAV